MAEIDRDRLAAMVEAKRNAGGLSIRQAAAACGIPAAQLNRARNRQHTGPGNYLVICQWLGISPYELLIRGGVPHAVSRETRDDQTRGGETRPAP